MIMKRFICGVISGVLMLPLLASCTSDGDESQSGASENTDNSFEASVAEALTTEITIDKINYSAYELDSDDGRNGVLIFRNGEDNAAPQAANASFFDAVVIDDMVCTIYPQGTVAVMPESGVVLRFRGEFDAIHAGSIVKGIDLPEYLPCEYIGFDKGIIEIRHANETRGEDTAGYFYDENWYAASTRTAGGIEIAISGDGRITEINKAGDTYIPDGGYVISINNSGSAAAVAAKLSVGDKAEHIKKELFYSVGKFIYNGKNRSRSTGGIVLFTPDKYDKTPVEDGYYTEVAVYSGRIIDIQSGTHGGTAIPENGYVISATGIQATAVASFAKKHMLVANDGIRQLRLINDPLAEYTQLCDVKNDYSGRLTQSKSNFMPLIYSETDMLLASAVKACDSLDSLGGDALASCILSLRAALDGLSGLLYPNITVGDRAAWVTVGELDYANNIVLHYKNDTDVEHAVSYAKGLGLNTLIIDSMVAGYAVYPSKLEGMVMLNELDGFDVIQAFATHCKNQGMRLIVMMSGYPIANINIDWPENHFMNLMKDKYLKTNKGRFADSAGTVTLDPSDDDVRKFQLNMARELAGYDIFGIQADYNRYPLPLYYQVPGYEDFGALSPAAKSFTEKYGVDPVDMTPQSELWPEWCAWRRNVISTFAKELYTAIKDVNPALNVSFTCFADYNDRQLYVYQDVEIWAKDGYADAIYPMIYATTTEDEIKYIEQSLTAAQNAPVVIGLGTYVRATQQSMCEQMILPFEYAISGSSNFTLRYISICGYDNAVRTVFADGAVPITGNDKKAICAACSELFEENTKSYEYLMQSESEGFDFAKLCSDIWELNSFATDEIIDSLNLILAHLDSYGTNEKAIKTAERDLRFILSAIS